MTYAATIVADSIASGVRLTTLEVVFPRYILAEFNTHRMLSRNSASSRAIPVKTRVQQVLENPFIPEFTKNKSGMQGAGPLTESADRYAESYWVGASKMAAEFAENLTTIEVHKQQANRVLEPYVWHTAVVTATDWDNFFALRLHPDAAPEIQRTARAMKDAMDASVPKMLNVGEWHLPYVDDTAGLLGGRPPRAVAVSVARCAAVSYERQRADKTLDEYVARHDALKASGHWSPFEHQARVATLDEIFQKAYHVWDRSRGQHVPVCIGNFRVPWLQYRKTISGEDVFEPSKIG